MQKPGEGEVIVN